MYLSVRICGRVQGVSYFRILVLIGAVRVVVSIRVGRSVRGMVNLF